MVAIVGGSGLGVFNSSLGVLGGQGGTGSAGYGRAGENVYLNALTGNLVIQRQDEVLFGLGPDLSLVRTYNSQGQFNDDNGDNWRLNLHKRLGSLTGTLNTANSTVTRTDADGAELMYTYDADKGVYVNTDGAGSYDTLSYDSATSQWTWTDGSTQSKETYDWDGTAGKLLSLADIDGHTVSYGYTGDLLTSVTDASGQTTHLEYVGHNLVSIRTVTANGVETTRVRYGYDALDRLTSVTVDLTPEDGSIADGKTYVTNYTYDGTSKRIASITQPDGSSVQFTYTELSDSSHRITQISQLVDGTNRITTLNYDLANNATTVTDPLGNATIHRYDSQGRLIQLQGPAVNGVSQTVSYTYDANGNVTGQTDALGNTISYEYDDNGNVVLQRDAAGNTITRTYGAKNELLTETVYLTPDPDGSGTQQPAQPKTTRYAYDAEGHLRFAVTAEGRVTEYRYNAAGQNITSLSYAGNAYDVSSLAVDAALDEANLSNWAGSADLSKVLRSDTTFDFRGQVETITRYASVDGTGAGIINGTQSTTRYVYDQAGRLLQTIAPKGVATTGNATDFVTSYTYDGLGRLLTSTDTLGRVTATAYDDIGNKTVTTLVNGLSTTSTYNAAGELVSITQANGATALGTTQYRYDAAGRLRMTQDATGIRNYILYDAAGRKIATIDGNGSITEYRYNANNQVIQTIAYATAVSATALSSLTDANGQPAEVGLDTLRPSIAPADRKAWNLYDAAGRLVKSIDALGYVTETHYDGASRVVSVTRYATAIDVNGLTDATLATDAAVSPAADAVRDRTTRYFHDDDGQQVATLDAEGYLTENEYDAAGRLVHTVTYATRTGAALRNTGSLDQLRPVASNDDIHGWNFYDAQNRVVGSINGQGYLTETIYDVNGNVTQTIAYATAAQIAPANITLATTLGQLRPASTVQDRITSYTYTDLNQVSTSTNFQGTVTRYTYDSVGNLVKTDKAFGTDEVRTVQARYDIQGRLTGELSAAGSALLANLAAPSQADIDALWAQYGITHSYDAAGRRTSTIDQNGHRTLFFYNEDGQLTHTVNAEGEVQSNRYNALGQLTDSIRHSVRIDASTLSSLNGGLVNGASAAIFASIANASDSQVSYAYNTRGELVATTDALGNINTVTYDAFGNVVGTTKQIDDTTSVATQYTVDRRGQVTQTTEDVGGLNRLTRAIYDAFGRTIQTTDALGNVTSRQYDRLGRVVATTDALNVSRSLSYDAFGQILTQTDGNGNTTTYSYDTANRSLTVTSAEGVSVTTISNRHGQTVEVIDGENHSTTYTYDENGNLESTTDALNHGTSSSYDRAGRVIETVDANGTRTVYTYDAANRVLSRTVDPTGLNLTTSYTYDAKGQVATTTNANGVVTQTEYDEKGQVTSVTVDPTGLNLITSYTYDAQGLTLTVTEGANSSQPRITRYTYDSLGRRTQETINPDGLNLATSYFYDGNNNVIKRIDANGHATRYVYDANHRLAYTIDAKGGVTRTSYDDNGNIVGTTAYATALTAAQLATLTDATAIGDMAGLVTVNPAQDRTSRTVYNADNQAIYSIDALGYVKVYQYDNNGRVTQTIRYADRYASIDQLPATVPATAVVETAEYDAAGRLVNSTDGLGHVTHRQYDNAGRVTDVTVAYGTSQAATTHYVYDAAGRVVEETKAHGTSIAITTRYAYDDLGNKIAEIDPRGVELAGTDSAWALAQRKALGYVNTDGSAKTVSQLTNTEKQALLNSYTSRTEYDTAGRKTKSIDALGGVTQYGYDARGNLTKLTDPLGNTAYFYYDANNRRTLYVDPEGCVTQTTYTDTGKSHTLTQYANKATGTWNETTQPTVTPDSNKDRVTTLDYDVLDQLVKSTDAEGYTEEYGYDALGNRISVKNKLGGITSYTYDAKGQVLTETLPVTSANASGVQIPVVNAFEYDARGNKIKTIEAQGLPEQRITSYTFDKLNRQVEKLGAPVPVFDPVTRTTSIVTPKEVQRYDARGNVIEVVDASGARSLTYYDAANRKIATVSPVGFLSVYSHDAAGNVIAQRHYEQTVALPAEAGGVVPAPTDTVKYRETLYKFDAKNQAISTTIKNVITGAPDPVTKAYVTVVSDLETTKVYDANGNVVKETDAKGYSVHRYYDKLGRQVAQVDQENYLISWEYGLDDKAVRQTAYANKVGLVVNTATTVADLINSAGVHADNRITETTYDRLARVVASRIKNVTSGSLNSAGQVTQATTDSVTSYTYNGLGLVTQKTDAIGGVTDTVYDILGRKTREQRPGYTDYQGNSVRPTTDYEYDGLSQVTRELVRGTDNTIEGDDRIIRYTYGAGGRLLSQTDPGNNTTYFSYDAAGRLTRQSYNRTSNGDVYTDSLIFAYDAQGRETRREVATQAVNADISTATVLETKETRYNAFGEITGKRTYGAPGTRPTNDNLYQETAAYDNAGRVWKSNSGDGVYKIFLYDKNGNSNYTIKSSGGNLNEVTDLMSVTLDAAKIHVTISEHDRRNQLTASYEPTMNIASQTVSINQIITNQTGEAYTGGDISTTTSTTGPLYGPGGRVDVPRGQWSSMSVTSTMVSDASRTGTKRTYSSSVALTVGVTTSAWGDGPVYVSVTLDPARRDIVIRESDDAYITFSGGSASLPALGANQTYTFNFNESSYSNGEASWDSLTSGLVRTYRVTITKVTGQGNIVLGTMVQNIVYGGMTTTRIGGTNDYPDYKYERVAQGSTSIQPPKLFTFPNDPGATRLLLQYRLPGQNAWSIAELGKQGSNFVFDWTYLPRGDYEYRYVALNASGGVVNSESGILYVNDSNPGEAYRAKQPINGPGYTFTDTAGSLHILGQDAAPRLVLRSRMPDGSWGSPIELQRYAPNGAPINGWFIFNPAVLQGAGSYEYLVEAYNASNQIVKRTVGTVAGNNTLPLTSLPTSPSVIQPTTPAVQVATPGISNTSLSSSLGLTSWMFRDQGSNSFTDYFYSSGSLQLALDTTAWGDGPVTINFTLDPASKKIAIQESDDGVINFSGYSTTLTLTAEQARNYVFSFNETSTSNREASWESLTSGLTRTYRVTVTKHTAQGDIAMGTMSRSMSLGGMTQSGVAGSDQTFTRAASGGASITPPKQFNFRNQPAGTARMFMQYKVAGQAGWNVMELGRQADAFILDWTNWARGNYEFQYTAVNSSGAVLNVQSGTFTVSDSAPAFNQTAKSFGGAGNAFFDKTGKLHITQQAAAQSLRLKYRTPNGWSAPIVLSPAGVNGWFVFDPTAYNLIGSFDYQIDAFSGAGTTGTLVNQAQGRFTITTMSLTNYHDLKGVIHFISQPVAATKLKVLYRPEGATGEYQVAWADKYSTGAFDWDASFLPPGRYEYIYEAYDNGNLLVNKAAGIVLLGSTPQKISHISHYVPTTLTFNVANTQAQGMKLYYRTAGSNSAFTAVPGILARADATTAFSWNASSVVPPNATATLDYYYELTDANGNSLLVDSTQPQGEGNPPLRVYGTAVVGKTGAADKVQWTVNNLVNTGVTIKRSQRLNAFGEVIQEIDGLDHVTDFVYNTMGRLVEKKETLVSITHANGYVERVRPTTQYTYDLAGRLIAVKDANNNVTTQSWLAGTGIEQGNEGRVATEFHADGGRIAKGYDIFGDVRYSVDNIYASINESSARRTNYEYDKLGRVTAVTRPSGLLADRYGYDEVGNRIWHTADAADPSVQDLTDRTTYDAMGRVTQTVSAGNLATTYTYTYLSNVGVGNGIAPGGYEKSVTMAYGKTSIERTDIFGRLVWRQDLGGHQYWYAYNTAGWLMGQTSDAGQNISYAYYGNGNIKSITDNILHTVTSYEYDREGNKTRETYMHEIKNADGGWSGAWDYNQSAEVFYDELNRVVRIDDIRADIRYEYDAVGNRRRVLSYYHDGVNGQSSTQEYWYQYDSMNRFVITMGQLNGGRATDANAPSRIVLGSTGVAIGYNAASERASATYGVDGHTETYTYSADGYLEDTYVGGALRARRTNDAFSRVTRYTEYNADGSVRYWRDPTYDAEGRVISETDSQDRTTFNTYANNGAGPLEHTRQVEGSTTINTYYTYEWWDEAKQSKITVDPSDSNAPRWKDGYSNFKYDVNGHLMQVDDPAAYLKGEGRTIRYVTNAQGLVLERTEIIGGTANSSGQVVDGKAKRHSFYYFDGHRVGDVGNDGKELKAGNLSYAEQLAQPLKSNSSNKDRYKNWKPIASADFDQNYQPINATYPGPTAGSYTVRQGDTLKSIAAAVWGDASMWYLIADANGLYTSDLTPNQVLTIPNKVTNIHNSSSTFKVYDAGEAIGNTSPTLPSPPPPPKKGCGFLAVLLTIVVAVVAVIATAGALAPAVAGQGLMTTGLQALTTSFSGLGLAGGTAGTLGLSGFAVAGAMGSIASQAVGIATGMQDKFSWSGVAKGAITSVIGAGVNSIVPKELFSSMGQVGTGLRAATGSLIGQGIGSAISAQSFSWRGVAAAGMSAGFNEALKGSSAFTEIFGKGFGVGFASSLAASAITNEGRLNAGAFGNAVGSGIMSEIAENLRPQNEFRGIKVNGKNLPMNWRMPWLDGADYFNPSLVADGVPKLATSFIDGYYTAKSGDNAYRIADLQMGDPNRLGAFVAANRLHNPNEIIAGKEYRIPASNTYSYDDARAVTNKIYGWNARNEQLAAAVAADKAAIEAGLLVDPETGRPSFSHTSQVRRATDAVAERAAIDRHNYLANLNNKTFVTSRVGLTLQERQAKFERDLGMALAGPTAIALTGVAASGSVSGYLAFNGLIGGGMDAAGQYSQTGNIRPLQTVFAAGTSMVTARLGMTYTSFQSNVLLGTTGNVVNTAFNNMVYEENNSLLYAGAKGALFSSLGYPVGFVTNKLVGMNTQPYIYLNFNKQVPALFQQRAANPVPEYVGAFAGGTISGTSSFVPDKEVNKR